MISAYLDRFTDSNEAVLPVESLQQEFHVPQAQLTANSKSKEGSFNLIFYFNN